MTDLVAGKHNSVSTAAGAVTRTLPTGLTAGSLLSVEKADTSLNKLTVSGSIRGVAGTITLSLSNESVEFVADSTGSWWPKSGHKTLSSLDKRYVTDALAPRMMATLALGQKSVSWLSESDSTGRNDTAMTAPKDGWVLQTANWLASQFPAYTVTYEEPTDDGAFGITMNAATTLQTGTAGGSAPVLRVVNAAIGGQTARFFTNDARQTALIKNVAPDWVTLNFGHNYAAELVQWSWSLMILAVLARSNSAGCELTLMAQNPEVAPAIYTTQQQARVSDVMYVGRILGASVVNVCQAFIDTGNPAGYINTTDGIHPNTAGQTLWASLVQAGLQKGLYSKAPSGSSVSPLHKPGANLVTNGAMAIDTGGTLTGWTLNNVTVSKDTVHTLRSKQGYSAKLTATVQNGFGAYVSQTLDLAQCKGRQVTAIALYYAPSGQAGDAQIGRLAISDGVKDAAHSRSLVNPAERNSFGLMLATLQVDPSSTGVTGQVFVTSDTSATEPGSNISVQEVIFVVGPEPRGLLTEAGPTGATGAAGAAGATGSGDRQEALYSAMNLVAQTVPFLAIGQGAAQISVIPSGEVTAGLVHLKAGDVVKGVVFGYTPASPTGFTLFKVFAYDASTGSLLASSADQSGTITSGLKSIPFTSTYTETAERDVRIGCLAIYTGGTISITRAGATSLFAVPIDGGLTAIAKQTGQTDVPATATFAAGNNTQSAFWFGAYK